MSVLIGTIQQSRIDLHNTVQSFKLWTRSIFLHRYCKLLVYPAETNLQEHACMKKLCEGPACFIKLTLNAILGITRTYIDHSINRGINIFKKKGINLTKRLMRFKSGPYNFLDSSAFLSTGIVMMLYIIKRILLKR